MPAPEFQTPSLQHFGCEADLAWRALQGLQSTYPGFRSWYWSKVVPGVERGSRRIFLSTDQSGLKGVVIAKRGAERKLCTVWVAPHARRHGVGRLLVADAMDWLETERPLITVSEHRAPLFLGLFQYFGFELQEELLGYYGGSSKELVFNGRLRPNPSS
ncbi:GNAT family N-acetyltransferase [Rubellimicrobium roseum]